MYAPGMAMPPGMEPPEVSSLKSMVNVARIVALVFFILQLLVLIGTFVALAVFPFLFSAGTVYDVIAPIVTLLIYVQLGPIRDAVNAGQYLQVKERLLIWIILGFIFGWIVVGVLLLLVYTKCDEAAAASQRMAAGPAWTPPAMSGAPAWQPAAQPPPYTPTPNAPTQYAAPSSAAPAPMAAPAAAPAAAATTCPRCGRPATWIAQYSRWYCYTDQQYV